MRKLTAKKALMEDYTATNAAMQEQKVRQRETWQDQEKREQYTYFPFVSGELIEKHR